MSAIKPTTTYLVLKRTLIAVASIGAIVLLLHLWFVGNARHVLKQYIYDESGGRFKLELSDLHLSLLSNQLVVNEADLVSTDSSSAPITYHVSFSKISLKVGSLWALIIQKKLLLDSIRLKDPVIQVMQWRKDTAQVTVKDELSIPQEMGKFYKSLQDALDEFGVRRIVIDNAKISLINKMHPTSMPVTVSNIFFDLARAPVRNGRRNIYSKNNQSVELRTTNQNIVLPGGRHHIAFKSFKLHLLHETIELDSCSVTAIATDTLKSSYKIFFKKLLLTDVDLAAMSTHNVIKADSVYCENPVFDFNLYRSDVVKKKTGIPDPNEIIRELTGNLDLAFVGVKNAGLHFDIYGKTKRSFFNSSKDNFEMQGLRINPDSTEPVAIKRFDMTLREYQLFNEDSSSTFSFDSLHFLNSKVVLNNFGIHSTSSKRKLRNEINITVPYFELSELDWSELIFNQNLAAKEAVLNSPVINFTRNKSSHGVGKFKLFDALQNIDSLVSLGNVSVVNGQLNMKLSPSTSFNFQNVDFRIYSNKLLRSVNKEGLRNAVDHLSFSRGVLRLKDVTAQLQNARFTGNNLLYADKVAVTGTGNKIVATVNNVNIDNMQLDDNAETIEVDGLEWKSANVALQALPSTDKNKGRSSIYIRNVAGQNTQLNINSGPTRVATFVKALNASSLTKKGDVLEVQGFFVAGNTLSLNSNKIDLLADSYVIFGDQPSSLKGVRVQQLHGQDSLYIQSSQINFATNLNDVFANRLHLRNVEATAPVIIFNKWDTSKIVRTIATKPTPLSIDKFTATEPAITISTHRNDSVSIINIPRSSNSIVEANGLNLSRESMQLKSLSVKTTAATFIKPTGQSIGVEKGKIDLAVSNIQLGRKDSKINWSGFINTLHLENADGLLPRGSKSNLSFKNASLGNLSVSSELLPDFNQLLKANVSAWLHMPQGEMIDSNRTVRWYNANYTNATRTLSFDSFIYHPTKSLDSTLAHAPYQLDYMTFKTGAININGLNVAQYEKDSSFIANTITIANPVLTVYRDKLPPHSPFRRDKKFPTAALADLSLPVFVDSLIFVDGLITYGEKNAESRKEGKLLLTNVNASVTNIKNSNLSSSDSLHIRLQANLMDAAAVNVHIKQSYKDSLQGFLFTGAIKPTILSILNPVFVPLSNIRITGGMLDSFSLNAIGSSNFTYGEMDVRYKRLKIQLVKDGQSDQSTFMQNVMSRVINTFVLKRNNTDRKGFIYNEKVQGQSFVNYIVKTAKSGMMSSIRPKASRKNRKLYQKQLKEQGLSSSTAFRF